MIQINMSYILICIAWFFLYLAGVRILRVWSDLESMKIVAALGAFALLIGFAFLVDSFGVPVPGALLERSDHKTEVYVVARRYDAKTAGCQVPALIERYSDDEYGGYLIRHMTLPEGTRVVFGDDYDGLQLGQWANVSDVAGRRWWVKLTNQLVPQTDGGASVGAVGAILIWVDAGIVWLICAVALGFLARFGWRHCDGPSSELAGMFLGPFLFLSGCLFVAPPIHGLPSGWVGSAMVFLSLSGCLAGGFMAGRMWSRQSSCGARTDG